MKLHFFTFRKPSTEHVKEQPIVRLSNRRSGDDSTNQGVSPLLEKTKNDFFLFRIIRHGRTKNGNKKSSINTATPTASHTSSSPTTPSSTNENSKVTTFERDDDLPVSFIRIVPNESSKRDLLQKMTSTNLMEKHGLDRNDSILSYLKKVDEAYNEMMVIVDDSPQSNVDSGNRAEFHDEQDAIDQGISMITMDPALMYNHSIILDEYSWQSFITLYESERYDNDDDESRDPPADARKTTVRYYDI